MRLQLLLGLTLVSTASAVTIEQSSVLVVPITHYSGAIAHFGKLAMMQQFDPSWGVLAGVTLTITIEVHATSTELNPFDTPFWYTPSISVLGNVASWREPAKLGDVPLAQGTFGDSEQLPTVLLENREIASVSGDFLFSFQWDFSSPSDLAKFVGTGHISAHHQVTVAGPQHWGGMYYNGNSSMVLTYVTVPDSAGTSLLLLGGAASVLGLSAVSRKRLGRV